MIFEQIRQNIDILDKDFDLLYPEKWRAISNRHFTPIEVAKTAAAYLVDKKGTEVLDVGAGIGKFCMIGAACTEGYFVGVEQRKQLCTVAKHISREHRIENIAFIHANVKDISFKAYKAFYIFNPFFENIYPSETIDNEVELLHELYHIYSLYVKEQLEGMPIGTKLATYHSFLTEVPDSYKVKFIAFENNLKMWQKMS